MLLVIRMETGSNGGICNNLCDAIWVQIDTHRIFQGVSTLYTKNILSFQPHRSKWLFSSEFMSGWMVSEFPSFPIVGACYLKMVDFDFLQEVELIKHCLRDFYLASWVFRILNLDWNGIKGGKIPTVGMSKEESKVLDLKVSPIVIHWWMNQYSQRMDSLEEGGNLDHELDTLNVKSEVIEVFVKMFIGLISRNSTEKIPETLKI